MLKPMHCVPGVTVCVGLLHEERRVWCTRWLHHVSWDQSSLWGGKWSVTLLTILTNYWWHSHNPSNYIILHQVDHRHIQREQKNAIIIIGNFSCHMFSYCRKLSCDYLFFPVVAGSVDVDWLEGCGGASCLSAGGARTREGHSHQRHAQSEHSACLLMSVHVQFTYPSWSWHN